MIICDPCWTRKREVTRANEEIVVSHNGFALCAMHADQVVELLSREDKRRRDKSNTGGKRASAPPGNGA